MRRYRINSSAFLFALAFLSATVMQAQNFSTHPCSDSDSSSGFLSHAFGQERACELRSATLPLVGGQVSVRGFNGSIDVTGEDRSDIALEARVDAHAHSQADAESLLHEIRILTSGTITADGPNNNGMTGWSVSFKLRVPRHIAAQLKIMNGSMKLASLEGDIQAETTNGSLSLSNLAGDVHVTTTNGSASVILDGDTWRGRGLSVQSTNRGVKIQMPGSYSAHLVAQTTNGGISSQFADQGTGRHHNSLDTTVGHGGPTLDFGTTNGGIAFETN